MSGTLACFIFQRLYYLVGEHVVRPEPNPEQSHLVRTIIYQLYCHLKFMLDIYRINYEEDRAQIDEEYIKAIEIVHELYHTNQVGSYYTWPQ